MNNVSKILIICLCFIVLLVGFIVVDETQADFDYANTTYSSPTRCDLGIIPIGSAMFGTVDALDEIYQLYHGNTQTGEMGLQNYLDILIKDSEEFLFDYPGACDYSKCKASSRETLVDLGADIQIYECLAFEEGCSLAQQVCFSACRQFECKGDPCSSIDLGDVLKDFKNSQLLISGLYDKINDFYYDLREPITKDIELSSDSPNSAITALSYLERKLQLSADLLTPYSGQGPRTCMPNESERKLIERGELEPREPMLCVDALKQGIYWPYPWSEWCQTECQYGATNDCMECLVKDGSSQDSCWAKNREISWQADINCQMFKNCTSECSSKQTLDIECYTCLCQRFEDDKSQEASCTDWLCNGRGNFVCCH